MRASMPTLLACVAMLYAAPAAEAGEVSKGCRARLAQMENLLGAARRARPGAVLFAEPIDGLILPSIAKGLPLDVKRIVVAMAPGALWLDGTPMPGAQRSTRLKQLSSRLATLAKNYKMLYPNEPTPAPRIYVIFDARLTVQDAVALTASLGRRGRLIPLAAPDFQTDVVPSGAAADARRRVLRAEVDAVTAATQRKLLEHALGSCKGLVDLAMGKQSEDEYRQAFHSHVQQLLATCDCKGANMEAVENLLLWQSGALETTMQRLPMELTATGGRPLVAEPDELMMSILAGYAGEGLVTVKPRAPKR